jgi:outer membrane receptor protein involved in Fe transport
MAALLQAGIPQATIDQTNELNLFLWRPQAWGGVPQLTGGNGGQINQNEYDMARVSASLTGTFERGWTEGVGWDVAVTYSDSTMGRTGVDTMITRLGEAINGLGGENCNGIAYGQPGSTCLFYNPFSNAHPRNSAYGYVNPGYIAANANSAEILDWMIERWNVEQTQSLFVVDGVLNGEFTSFSLPGGNMGWAMGTQYRKTEYQTKVDNPLANSEITPCPIPGDGSCSLPTGPFIFLGQFINQSLEDDVIAFFGELAIPILDNLDVQLAVRYEDYGGLTGDTTDPKISVRWQATEGLAFRASAGSTFRGPTPVNIALRATGLQPIPAAAQQYRSIDFTGNPELKPETADTFSMGVIAEYGSFRGILDYWNYDFEDQITSVPFTPVSDAVGNIAAGSTGAQLANCNHGLRYLVIFDQNDTCTQGVTTGNQMQRIAAPVVNGSTVEIAGFDLSLNYVFNDLWNGELALGFDATFVDTYDVGAFAFGGVPILGAYEAAGLTNYTRFPGSVPEFKGLGFVNYNTGPWNVRYELRYVKGVTDERASPSVNDSDGNPVLITYGKKVDDYYANNLHLSYQAPWDTILTFSIVNLMDEDPSEARHQLSYDPYYGDPLGRTFKLGFRKTFSRN